MVGDAYRGPPAAQKIDPVKSGHQPSARPHPARPGGPVAQTRRAPDRRTSRPNGRGFRRFGALVFEAPPHDRPMTSALRGGILRIAPGQTRMKTQDLGKTRKDPDGL